MEKNWAFVQAQVYIVSAVDFNSVISDNKLEGNGVNNMEILLLEKNWAFLQAQVYSVSAIDFNSFIEETETVNW
jgi:hypothetical protein